VGVPADVFFSGFLPAGFFAAFFFATLLFGGDSSVILTCLFFWNGLQEYENDA
jgi:hypothetical protein